MCYEHRSGSPPLARGVPTHNILGGISARITPACAGSTLDYSLIRHNERDHPRLRGEYLIIPTACNNNIWITPACAGSTVFRLWLTHPNQDHPRLRGEYQTAEVIHKVLGGSPPLARGVRLYPLLIGMLRRITPACAGSTSVMSNLQERHRDHPRLRGEYLSGRIPKNL